VPSRRTFEPAFRSVIFDLDETLIDSRPAWCYTLEETLMSIANRRISAQPLAEEYQSRPWSESLSILIDDPEELRQANKLCERIAERSAMKKLLVFDGTGMALDDIRGARLEIGAISRLPHAVALKQAQATGLDRFLTVLSATPSGLAWDPRARLTECLSYFGREPTSCLFVGASEHDIEQAIQLGLMALQAGWPHGLGERQAEGVGSPAAVVTKLLFGFEADGLSRAANEG